MAWAPLTLAEEERDEERPPPLIPQDGLAPRDYLILGKVFEGKKASAIAQELGLSVPTVKKRMELPGFQQAVRQVEGGIMERVARGEFGVLAIAKAQAVGSVRRLLNLARNSLDDRVKLQANLALLKYAGVREPEPMKVESPERIIDAMNAEELERFTQDGIFPERFTDQLARLTTASMQKAESWLRRPQIEQLADEREPHERRPKEVEEAW